MSNMLTTPATITPAISQFCERVNGQSEPAFVPVKPEHEASNATAFAAIAEKVAKDGGNAVEGWIVWANSYMIEAESHVVWESEEGQMLDIVRKPDGERKILFLPQPGLWDGSQPLPNKRQALVDTRESRAVFHRGARWDEMRAKFWKDGIIQIPYEEGMALEQMAYQIARGVPVNDPCPCGSGKKYKKCCGAPAGTPLTNF